MYVTKFTDEYDDITDSNFTNKCTNSETGIDLSIPTFLLTIPCGPASLCLMCLTIYTIIKPLMK